MMELAKRIVDTLKEFDFFSFCDAVENEMDTINKVYNDIISGNISGIISAMVEIIESDYTELYNDAFSIIAELA